ncbi:MAG: hypothetical protein IPP38_18350 [Bacteroidetes bacterium]|nr:hypothetical protein [Bacteroidota bacterium]
MKKQLQKGLCLHRYSIDVFTLSNAQVVYTDVNPDMVLSCIFQTNCSRIIH